MKLNTYFLEMTHLRKNDSLVIIRAASNLAVINKIKKNEIYNFNYFNFIFWTLQFK